MTGDRHERQTVATSSGGRDPMWPAFPARDIEIGLPAHRSAPRPVGRIDVVRAVGRDLLRRIGAAWHRQRRRRAVV